MTKLKAPVAVPADVDGDLATLRGDCARMAGHWHVPDRTASGPVSPSLIHGVEVPSKSARLLDAMSDYGD